VVVVVGGGPKLSRHAIPLALPVDVSRRFGSSLASFVSCRVIAPRQGTSHVAAVSQQTVVSGVSETRVISSTVAKGPEPAGEGP
jgi:predicted phosphoribosyltransferase